MPTKPKTHSERQRENSPFAEFYKRYEKEKDLRRGTAAERGYDAKWRQVRALYIKRFPLCADCAQQGRTTPASEVHHLQKIKDKPELAYRFDNLLSLCHLCHSKRTAKGE